jgi:hypothetical protein
LARRPGVSAFMPPVTAGTALRTNVAAFHARSKARPGSAGVMPAVYSRPATVSPSAVTGWPRRHRPDVPVSRVVSGSDHAHRIPAVSQRWQ